MSNKTQLSNNNTKLASLIQTLQGKATGGGGTAVETCTVTLDTSAKTSTSGSNLIWVGLENDEITLKTAYFGTLTDNYFSMILPTIVCVKGSSIILGKATTLNDESAISSFSCTGGVEAVSYEANTLGCYFKVTDDGSITWL